VGSQYPQGLSLPLRSGYTKADNPGAFMDHEDWGPCYVELDYSVPGKLFVYKLNKGMDILREKMMRESSMLSMPFLPFVIRNIKRTYIMRNIRRECAVFRSMTYIK